MQSLRQAEQAEQVTQPEQHLHTQCPHFFYRPLLFFAYPLSAPPKNPQPFDHLKGVTSSQWGHNEVHSGLAHYLGQSSASHWHIDTHMLSNGMGDMLPKPSVSTVWHMSAFV
eukprot:scaffold3355_cov20-Tisochrysis_lutea.AAC.1